MQHGIRKGGGCIQKIEKKMSNAKPTIENIDQNWLIGLGFAKRLGVESNSWNFEILGELAQWH